MSFTIYDYRLKDRDYQRHATASSRKPFKFPGGEMSIDLSSDDLGSGLQVGFLRGADSDSLFAAAMWRDVAKRSNRETILVLPYLPAARADRGLPLGAKVYADFVNSLNFGMVIALDPHSDVAPALYNHLNIVHLEELPFWEANVGQYVGVIAPDLGARKRSEAVAAKLGVPVFQATKHRDFATGKLSHFACEELPAEGNLIVVDDICDGGGTFMGLADVINRDPRTLHLWVTHGIFSKNATGPLRQRYGRIITTDSHDGVDLAGPIEVIKVMKFLLSKFI